MRHVNRSTFCYDGPSGEDERGLFVFVLMMDGPNYQYACNKYVTLTRVACQRQVKRLYG